MNGYAEVQPNDVSVVVDTTPATTVNNLAILDEQEVELKTLADQYKNLSIAGIDDKEGYKVANDARLILKKRRTKVENDAEALRANAVKFQRTVIAREKQLVGIIAAVEIDLKSKVDAIDKEKERLRIEEERREDARIQSRIDQLAKFGHGLDLYDAKIMPEENFQALLGHAEAEWNKEQQRIADEKANAEQERLAELERMRIEREQLTRQQEEFAKREAELKALRDRELEEQRQRDIAIKAEQDRKEAELRAEREKLEAEKRVIAEQKAKAEAEERARIESEEKVRREAEAKAESERLAKIEAERQEALRPDKEKLISYINQVFQSIPYPTVSTDSEVNTILKEIISEMGSLYERLEQRINDLK
jgi:colicin import membrane protein